MQNKHEKLQAVFSLDSGMRPRADSKSEILGEEGEGWSVPPPPLWVSIAPPKPITRLPPPLVA